MDIFNAIGTVEIEAAKGSDKPPRVTIVAYTGGLMTVPGWGPVAIDTAALQTASDVVLLADHVNEIAAVVGRGSPIKTGNALGVEGTISLATPAGRMLVDLARDGVRLGASVGVEIADRQRIKAGESIIINGQTIVAPPGGLLLVKAGTLREVSICPVAADSTTTVSIAAKGTKNMEPKVLDENTIRASERERLATINQLCTPSGGGWGIKSRRVDELRASALDGEISVDELRAGLLDVLRAARPTSPSMDGGGRPLDNNILTASLCLTAQCDAKILAADYGQAAVDAAMSAPNRGVTLHGIMRQVLRAAGRQQPEKFSAATIREVFEADLQLRASGFSTISLPGILGNAANKLLLDGYGSVNPSWPLFCSVATHSDFKGATAYRMTGIGSFVEVGKGGTLTHLTLGEESYTNTVHTEGCMISITRQDLVNDDLNAFAALPRSMGRMSNIAIEKAVYTALLANTSDFFGTAHGNYDDGTDSALGIDSLAAAEQKFLEQVDSNGDPVMISPRFVLVPPALSTTAARMLSERVPALVGSTTANSLLPATNPFAGKYTPVVSPWLTNSSLTGNSDTGWYLLAGASEGVTVVEVAFLGGNRTPVIESGATDFNTLGVQMRAYHDFGAALQDYRGGVFYKGTT